jgi:hypothetical protein
MAIWSRLTSSIVSDRPGAHRIAQVSATQARGDNAIVRGLRHPLVVTQACDRVRSAGAATVVLVEGVSDRAALETLAVRQGRDLGQEGVAVVAMGGATNVGHFLGLLGPPGLGVRLAGLCDEAEEGDFHRGLERAGLGSGLTRGGAERLGFFVCVADLEDELIRSLGVAAVEEVARGQGELGAFRTFQKQPAHRGTPPHKQLRHFMATHSGRKAQYARLLVEALDLDRVPRPLDRVLAHVVAGQAGGEVVS